ncbi:MAG: hypothetical protein M0009_03365 [Deltaproteobacteria bacterium]|nr:hypothetical protein [Deltaproteobacteria bacterium]
MAVKKWFVVFGVLFVFGIGEALAQHGHDHGAAAAAPAGNAGMMMPHQMPLTAVRSLQSATVDGLKISVDIMGMGMHAHMQEMKGTPLPATFDRSKGQAIMVTIEAADTKKVVKDAEVTVTVIGPKGETTTGKAPWYGDHYGASFGSDEDGTYRIVVAAVSNGVKREAEFKHIE